MLLEDMLAQSHRTGSHDTVIRLAGDTAKVTFVGTGGVADRFELGRGEAEAAVSALASHCDEDWTMPLRHGRISAPGRVGLPPEVAALRYATMGMGEAPWASADRIVTIRMLPRSLDH